MLIDVNDKKLMKSINYCVYRFISPTGKSYIGITTNLFIRYLGHKRNYSNTKTKFYDACKSYGFENFQLEVLCKDITNRCCLNTLEKLYINSFNSLNEGYNMTKGGDGNSQPGELNGMFGRKHTEEAKAKMSRNAYTTFGKDNPLSSENVSKEKRSEYIIKSKETIAKNLAKLTEDEKKEIKRIKSERAKKTWDNMSDDKRENAIKALRYELYKSEEEMIEINKKKARPKELNGRATYYHLISPNGEEFLVSLIDGLKDFCTNNNLVFNLFYKYRNKDLIPEPSKTDNKLRSDEDYKIRRLNSTGWKVNHLRRIKI